ncbi:hypothetical protein [Salinithrix halophila]|uniref:Uncharacterized protein n=1 Tax=Salinithrix halophila TaxID=1485204 RepID=A0ABV8JJE5_9BACL
MAETLDEHFLRQLILGEGCREAFLRNYAGVQFLYILPATAVNHKEIRCLIDEKATDLTRNSARFHECQYVRQSRGWLVFRFRFRFPDEKSFCCGNQCIDCVLLHRGRKR